MSARILAMAGITTAGLLATVVSASAGIACVGPVCWHTTERYTYPPEARVVVREDTWKPGPDVRWREHAGRGYWRDDKWVEW